MTIDEKTLIPIGLVVSIVAFVIGLGLTYTRNEVDHAKMAVKIEENTESIDKLTEALQRLHPSLTLK
jgi:type II secretory pathway pseudopilin PulG